VRPGSEWAGDRHPAAAPGRAPGPRRPDRWPSGDLDRSAAGLHDGRDYTAPPGRSGYCSPAPAGTFSESGHAGIHAPYFHLRQCAGAGPSPGLLRSEGRQALREAFKKELKRAGFGPLARANNAGCLEQCEHGPTVVIYPQGIWYGRVTVADVPRIVATTLLGGEILTDLLIPDSCLNDPDCPHRIPRKG
jgi:(2Fe-2S) ferredoxin